MKLYRCPVHGLIESPSWHKGEIEDESCWYCPINLSGGDGHEGVTDEVCGKEVELDERRYTLPEAKLELARQECAITGHDWQTIVYIGRNAPSEVICDRCGQAHEVLVASGE